MSEHWMPSLTLTLTPEEYRQLPRHPGYRYEYLNGQAYLMPHGRHYHAFLELRPIDAPPPVTLRPIETTDFAELARLFADAFYRTQPFASLDDATRLCAAQEALERTFTGRDGPWIERASFVAVDQQKICGAIFITLLPAGDLTAWDSFYWDAAPPADAIERRLGRPHLTWIFVAPLRAGQGLGTSLLAAAVGELLGLGFTELASTFMLGNDTSVLWHWRNGFRLLTYPGSLRRLRMQKRDRGHA
jgi:GNAT superfamily N-acetyltransferase